EVGAPEPPCSGLGIDEPEDVRDDEDLPILEDEQLSALRPLPLRVRQELHELADRLHPLGIEVPAGILPVSQVALACETHPLTRNLLAAHDCVRVAVGSLGESHCLRANRANLFSSFGFAGG